MSNSEPDVALYRLYKEEIKREDDIVFQRNMSSLTFQGFLFASATFLISNPWLEEPAVAIYPFRQFVLGLQGFTGVIVALLTAAGVMAAASSISSVSAAYFDIKPKNPDWPQLHGGPREFSLGGAFAIALHFSLAILWSIYEVVLIANIFPISTRDIAIISVLLGICIVGTFFGTRTYLAGFGSQNEAGKDARSATSDDIA